MARRPALLALLLLALAAAPGVAGSAGERLHRLHVPPPPAQALPQSLAVDEFEWGMRGTHLEVAAGACASTSTTAAWTTTTSRSSTPTAQVHSVPLASGADAVLEADVGAGPLRLYCSLFAGTPDSHVAKGMVFDLTAR